MIRAESFAVSRETFAAERKNIVASAAERLRPHVADAANRIGLPAWERPAVAAALDVFDETARAEVDEWNAVIDDMRDLFQHEMSDALGKTKRVDPAQFEVQVDRLTNWMASMAVNAGTEAATTSDPDTSVGLEWITMGDGEVRHSHQEANGQTVPTGNAFSIGDVEMMYPGQPVGDPENWINCRCVVQPAMLTEASAKTITAAADSDVSRETFAGQGNASDPGVEEGEEPRAAVIVLRPRVNDPVTAIASGTHPHCTLLYLGDGTFDMEPLKQIVEATAKSIGHVLTDKVSGRAVLGEGEADVMLLDASGSSTVRAALMENDGVLDLLGMQEQYPAWIPHLTLGYPEAPAEPADLPEDVTYDLLSIWRGNETYDYPLEPAVPDTKENPALSEAYKANLLRQFAGTALEEKTDGRPSDADVSRETEPAAPAAEDQLAPWHGVLAPESVPSGDSREFLIKALTMRTLPLPLKAMFKDAQGHEGSVVVGRIDEIYRDGGLIKAAGVWDISEDAIKAAGMIERKMWRGVSVDLDAAEGEMVEAAEDGGAPSIKFSKGRVCSATLCAIPAFAEAFIRNGTWAEFANEPMPTGEMNEIPDWTGASLVASAFIEKLPADAFRNPELTELTPLTITEDGRVFGHIAGWETCHIGYEVCTTAPASLTDYAYFLTGQVFTDAGPVAVGQITMGTGHADGTYGLRAAVSHYDNTGSVAADVTCGDDEHGIWFSGMLREHMTPSDVRELAAAGLSGDWRTVRVGGQESYEMVAALAVNVGGFPIPRPRFAVENQRQLSLVAAGIVMRPQHLDDDDAFAAQMERYVARKERAQRVAALRSEVRAELVAKMKTEMLTVGGK